MNADDYPRIASLTFRILSSDSHKYAEEAALEGQLIGFRFQLRCRDAVFYPLTHFGSAAAALAVLTPQLRAWELQAALTEGIDVLAFKYVHAHLEKTPPQPGVELVQFAAQVVVQGFARGTVTHNVHPSPPTGFAVDEFVETLGALFLFAKRTPLALLYVGYSMTTCVETYLGPKSSVAANALGFSSNVFDRINDLATNRGIGAVARKFKPGETRTPLSNGERSWLETMLELIVRRAAAVAAGEVPGEKITLSSHPLVAEK
jgi:hypothetical protein